MAGQRGRHGHTQPDRTPPSTAGTAASATPLGRGGTCRGGTGSASPKGRPRGSDRPLRRAGRYLARGPGGLLRAVPGAVPPGPCREALPWPARRPGELRRGGLDNRLSGFRSLPSDVTSGQVIAVDLTGPLRLCPSTAHSATTAQADIRPCEPSASARDRRSRRFVTGHAAGFASVGEPEPSAPDFERRAAGVRPGIVPRS